MVASRRSRCVTGSLRDATMLSTFFAWGGLVALSTPADYPKKIRAHPNAPFISGLDSGWLISTGT